MDGKKLSDEEILAVIGEEISNSAGGGSENDALFQNRRDALSAYLGDKGEIKEGRSSVVSTDVADAIEWILPEIIKSFTQNNEVVTFDACDAKDKHQAEMESRFVYDTLMKENEGFIVLHTFIKDALLQKNGFLKVYYDDETCVTTEDYTGLTEPELMMLQADPEVEITGLSENVVSNGKTSIKSYDINVKRSKLGGKVVVEAVSPDEIRVNSDHNSVSLESARFIAHEQYVTRSDLVKEGIPEEEIDTFAQVDSAMADEQRSYRFSMQGESYQFLNNTGDESQQYYIVNDCVTHMDIDGDGVAEFVRIRVVGRTTPTHILSVEEIGYNPFISATAIMMSHKLYGLSIYDRLIEIQRQKTALWRNTLDNIYLQNNQRMVVVNGQVNLDDALTSRPGGIIRANSANSIAPLATPALSGDVYKMFDYLDQVRSGRAGVSPEGSIHDSAMGDSVGSQGLDQLLTQKEELVGLMVRVFAETGIKPLCYKIRELLVMHHDVAVDYEFHGEWQKVVPSKWRARKNTTVRVGTGSGNRKQQAAAIQAILGFQEKLMAKPGQALVGDGEIFTALNDFAKFNGMPGASAYFLDPASPEGQKRKQQITQQQQQAQQKEAQEQQMLAKAQTMVAEAKQTEAQAAMQSVNLKAQIESMKQQLDSQKAQSEATVKMLQQQLAEAKQLADTTQKGADLQYRYYDTDTRAAIEYTRIQQQEKAAEASAKAAANNQKSGESDD